MSNSAIRFSGEFSNMLTDLYVSLTELKTELETQVEQGFNIDLVVYNRVLDIRQRVFDAQMTAGGIF